MKKINNSIYDKFSAGEKVIGFDYQFYYFMCLALELKHGQKVGFEVKDDIHIDKADGSTVLFQAKHTVQSKEDGSPQNLATLDIDLWKTLSNWSEMIKTSESILSNHYFCLITNKSDDNNQFLDALSLFKTDGKIDVVIEILQDLKLKTKDRNIKSYIKNVLSLGKKRINELFKKLKIETGIDDIVNKVKMKIFECTKNIDLVDPVFESLATNLNVAKYLDIKNRKKFEITFDDFNERFGKCFRIAFEKKPLPKRTFAIKLPEDLEEQTFIKQLIDIGEVTSGSFKIIDYTTQMLQVLNHLSYWSDNNFILPTEMEEFQKEAIAKWTNEFNAKYRQIERKINSGSSIEDLEVDIQLLGLEIIDFLRKENLTIADDVLGVVLSNGHYYALSDKPVIGWHYDWNRKYNLL